MTGTNRQVLTNQRAAVDLTRMEEFIASELDYEHYQRVKPMLEEIAQLRGNLSLAEEGLANYALEVERLRAALQSLLTAYEGLSHARACVGDPPDAEAVAARKALGAPAEPSACNCGCKVPDGHHWQCPQYKPAVKSDAGLQCTFCDGTGMVDSGGVQPWGEAIFVACPECSPSRTGASP